MDDAHLYTWVADTYGVQFPESRSSKAFSTGRRQATFPTPREYLPAAPRVGQRAESGHAAGRLPGRQGLGLHPGRHPQDSDRSRPARAAAWLQVRHRPRPGRQARHRQEHPARAGGKWFSDSLSLADTRDKTAAEKLQGVWIMEIGEMQGTPQGRRRCDEGLHQPPGGRVPRSLWPGRGAPPEDGHHLRHHQQHRRLPERHHRQPALLACHRQRGRPPQRLGDDRGDPRPDLG